MYEKESANALSSPTFRIFAIRLRPIGGGAMSERPNRAPNRPDQCVHAEQALRRRIVSNGVMHYVLQCQRCGKHMRNVGPGDPLRAALTEPPPMWDSTLSENYWAETVPVSREFWAAERQAREDEWWNRYNEYLASDEWRTRADLRLAKDGHRCQAQLAGCTGRATQVHHLDYRHLGNEPLFDLISVCRHCHELIPNRRTRATEPGYAAAD